MTNARKLKVAALVDLLRSPQSGGHVKGWERLAHAAATLDLPLDLTVYFSGAAQTEQLAPHVTLRQLPPIFSTARLKFLPYLPDHTDLAPYHPRLAAALRDYDVIHTTDAHFAFTRTAERLARRNHSGLTHSFHTDQPGYAEIFTAKAITDTFGKRKIARKLIEDWQFPLRARRRMERRRAAHLGACDLILATRPSDRAIAEQVVGPHDIRHLRLGTDKTMFNPRRSDRAGILARYNIPPNRMIVVFVGRLDEGKNIYTLLEALAANCAAGLPFHLVTAGIGPAESIIRERLPHNASIPGFIAPEELATLYASADIMALVSEIEIRSMAMVESLASGLPVLVAARNGLARLFPASPAIREIHGGAAEWRDALAHCAQPGEHRAMLQAARHFADHHIASWQQILAEDLFPAWRESAAMARRR